MKFPNCYHHLLLISVYATIAGTSCIFLSAKSSPNSTKSLSSLQSSHFKRARNELGRDWYVVYTIFDRLSRSNNLDKYSWRIRITDEYETQAYASEDNLVAIPRGVLDIANAGDTSTLACIIGHEVAHHTLEHKSKIPANYFQLKNDKIREVEEKIKLVEKRKKEREESIRQYEKNLAQPNMPSWLKKANEIGLAVAKALPEPKPIDPEKLKQEAGNQIDSQFYANLRNQELEADREGFTYAVRAGFDKEGCINLFDILARSTSSKIDRSDGRHPTVELRKNQILQLTRPDHVTQLIKEGKFNRSGKMPLSYELNKNLGWLRVNTRMGSAQNDFNRLFTPDN
jgi:hypothetical protein